MCRADAHSIGVAIVKGCAGRGQLSVQAGKPEHVQENRVRLKHPAVVIRPKGRLRQYETALTFESFESFLRTFLLELSFSRANGVAMMIPPSHGKRSESRRRCNGLFGFHAIVTSSMAARSAP
jgi:hypothetical protein